MVAKNRKIYSITIWPQYYFIIYTACNLYVTLGTGANFLISVSVVIMMGNLIIFYVTDFSVFLLINIIYYLMIYFWI